MHITFGWISHLWPLTPDVFNCLMWAKRQDKTQSHFLWEKCLEAKASLKAVTEPHFSNSSNKLTKLVIQIDISYSWLCFKYTKEHLKCWGAIQAALVWFLVCQIMSNVLLLLVEGGGIFSDKTQKCYPYNYNTVRKLNWNI